MDPDEAGDSVLEAFVLALPGAVLLVREGGILRGANEPAERLLGLRLVGRSIDEVLLPGRFASGRTLSGVLDGFLGEAAVAEAAGGGVARPLVVRRGETAPERDAVALALPAPGRHPGTCVLVLEGGARDELVELRGKARETAHALNNVIMTVLGHLSLARLHADDPAEVRQGLEAAERNLLRVRDLTAALQVVARRGG